MDPADVERLARYVQEHGGAGRSESWYARAEKDDATKHEVDLPSPVPVEIDR